MNIIPISASNIATMEKRSLLDIAGLKKRISLAEIIILLMLVMVWGGMFWAMNVKKEKYIHTMVAFQEQVLALAQDRLEGGMEISPDSWPMRDPFQYFIVRDSRIVSSNHPGIEDGGMSLDDAFGRFINSQEIIPRIKTGTDGSNWIRSDKVTPRLWLSWSTSGRSSEVLGIISNEEDLLALTGYPDFRFMLLVCAGLASALLLLALIWALSWMRLSAVKGLSRSS